MVSSLYFWCVLTTFPGAGKNWQSQVWRSPRQQVIILMMPGRRGGGKKECLYFCIFFFFRQHVVTAGHCIKNKQLNNINVTLGEVYYTIMMMIFAMICFEQWENGLELDFANLCTSTTLGRSWRLIQAGHTRWDSCWIVDGDPSSSSSETKEKKTYIPCCWIFGCLIVVCRSRWPRWLSTPTSSSAQQQTGSRPDI